MLNGAGLLFGAAGEVVVARGDFRTRARHRLRRLTHARHHLAQAVLHFTQLRHQAVRSSGDTQIRAEVTRTQALCDLVGLRRLAAQLRGEVAYRAPTKRDGTEQPETDQAHAAPPLGAIAAARSLKLGFGPFDLELLQRLNAAAHRRRQRRHLLHHGGLGGGDVVLQQGSHGGLEALFVVHLECFFPISGQSFSLALERMLAVLRPGVGNLLLVGGDLFDAGCDYIRQGVGQGLRHMHAAAEGQGIYLSQRHRRHGALLVHRAQGVVGLPCTVDTKATNHQ